MIEYIQWWKDPKDEQYFSYYVSKDKKNFQLMSFLEDKWNLQLTKNILNQTNAVDYTKRIPTVSWKKLWILTESWTNIPIQEIPSIVLSWYLDIVTTNSSYNSYFTDTEIISGTWKILYQVNPLSSCKRIFDVISNKSEWEFIINPYWTETLVYCNRTFITQNYYDYVEDWDMENAWSSNWPSSASLYKTTEDKYTWTTSLKSIANWSFMSNNFTYIEPWKKYRLEWYFKSVWTVNSMLYYGFAEFDKDFNIIYYHHVGNKIWTETTLSSDVNANDTSVNFYCDDAIYNAWKAPGNLFYHSVIAFNVDDSGSYNDLPNRNLSNHISTSTYPSVSDLITKLWNICTFTFHPSTWNKVWLTYPAWTKIREHSYWWRYNYKASSWDIVPNTWTKYSWDVSWISLYWADQNYFRRWTKFVKILLLTNYAQWSTSSILMDDLKLTKLD